MPTTYAIPNGATVFAATTWTGADTGTGRSISGLQFAPDLWWGKSRSAGYYHQIFDSVRGAGSGKALASNDTGAEGIGNGATYGYLSSFDSSGVTYTRGSAGSGTNPDGYAYYDESGTTYVGWGWKAGGAAVSNTAGSITSQVSANTTAGFSVVTYTGTSTGNGDNKTVGHGLGVAPKFVIVKAKTGGAENWYCWHTGLTSGTYYVVLNSAAGQTNDNTRFYQAPSSSLLYLGGNTGVSATGYTYVAYCWSEVAGYSAFGSYTGNGSTDGPFVYCGFRPRFVMAKNITNASDWFMTDTSRDPYNVTVNKLTANTSTAESSNAGLGQFDILSNGFKQRQGAGTGLNNSGDTYIYAAFAENPFKYANAR